MDPDRPRRLGTQPLDPSLVAQARARVIKNVGRPPKNEPNQVWPMRLLRCVHCHYGIKEGHSIINGLTYMMCRCPGSGRMGISPVPVPFLFTGRSGIIPAGST